MCFLYNILLILFWYIIKWTVIPMYFKLDWLIIYGVLDTIVPTSRLS